MDPSVQTWIEIVQVGGTVATLGLFTWLFWKGEIVSRETLDRIVKPYQEESAKLSNGFGDKLTDGLKEVAETNKRVETALTKYVDEGRESRQEMQRVVMQIMVGIAEVGSKPRRTARKAK